MTVGDEEPDRCSNGIKELIRGLKCYFNLLKTTESGDSKLETFTRLAYQG